MGENKATIRVFNATAKCIGAESTHTKTSTCFNTRANDNTEGVSPDKFKIVEIQLAMLDHFLYGICTLKGHKMINKYKQLSEEE